ncbi:Hypothetical predicted protein [Octopus vulgaris]|uniref:Uncharacterized protein n=1 Tax=Octopus vulgaris TaxID=6645 RepID=A0AA36BVD4_OCTVU|nr:Hypothetical predicted protein [Octopus vulgaris]
MASLINNKKKKKNHTTKQKLISKLDRLFLVGCPPSAPLPPTMSSCSKQVPGSFIINLFLVLSLQKDPETVQGELTLVSYATKLFLFFHLPNCSCYHQSVQTLLYHFYLFDRKLRFLVG